MKKLFVAIIFVLIGFTSCTSSNNCKDCKNELNFVQRYKRAKRMKEKVMREHEIRTAEMEAQLEALIEFDKTLDSLEVTPIIF